VLERLSRAPDLSRAVTPRSRALPALTLVSRILELRMRAFVEEEGKK